MSPLGHIQWGLGLPQLQATGGAFVVLTPLPPALSWVHSTWGWKEWNLRLQVGGECARIVQSSGQKWQELGVWGAGNLGPPSYANSTGACSIIPVLTGLLEFEPVVLPSHFYWAGVLLSTDSEKEKSIHWSMNL